MNTELNYKKYLLNLNKHPMMPIKTSDETFLPLCKINYNPYHLASMASKKSYPPIYAPQFILAPKSNFVANIPSRGTNFDLSAIRCFDEK